VIYLVILANPTQDSFGLEHKTPDPTFQKGNNKPALVASLSRLRLALGFHQVTRRIIHTYVRITLQQPLLPPPIRALGPIFVQ
jgi:hypothetical protein